MDPVIAVFVVDEVNEEKFWSHGLTSLQVVEVIENPFTIVRNRGDRRASHLVIGRDNSGQCIAIPIEATQDPHVWRPVTAWRCKISEAARLPRRR
jgi:hypothetical protein